jgi:hypothetical protein
MTYRLADSLLSMKVTLQVLHDEGKKARILSEKSLVSI